MNVKRILPLVGIVAFSLCSTYSVFQLLTGRARHPSLLFWIPSVAIELFTAWAIYQTVEQARKVTQSNISKQDRRFHGLVLALFLVVAIPTLVTSVVANTLEFGGSILLGLLFPIASVGCAIGVALPDTLTRYDLRKQAEATRAQADRKRAQEERKAEATRAQERAREAQARRKQFASLGKAGATFEQLCANPMQSQASLAQVLGKSRQAIGNDIAKLERVGAIKRNGDGVEILWETLGGEEP